MFDGQAHTKTKQEASFFAAVPDHRHRTKYTSVPKETMNANITPGRMTPFWYDPTDSIKHRPQAGTIGHTCASGEPLARSITFPTA